MIFEPASPLLQSRMLSIFRIVAGVIFITTGTMKMFGYPAAPVEIPPFEFMTEMGIAGLLEVFGGLLITLGLLTRPVAFILAGQMAVAYFKYHAPLSLFPTVNNGVPAILFCFFFLYLAFSGAGAWSIDALIARRRRGPTPIL